MKNIRLDAHEVKLLINALNVKECELINEKWSESQKGNDVFNIDTDIDYVQILLAKLGY